MTWLFCFPYLCTYRAKNEKAFIDILYQPETCHPNQAAISDFVQDPARRRLDQPLDPLHALDAFLHRTGDVEDKDEPFILWTDDVEDRVRWRVGHRRHVLEIDVVLDDGPGGFLGPIL